MRDPASNRRWRTTEGTQCRNSSSTHMHTHVHTYEHRHLKIHKYIEIQINTRYIIVCPCHFLRRCVKLIKSKFLWSQEEERKPSGDAALWTNMCSCVTTFLKLKEDKGLPQHCVSFLVADWQWGMGEAGAVKGTSQGWADERIYYHHVEEMIL